MLGVRGASLPAGVPERFGLAVPCSKCETDEAHTLRVWAGLALLGMALEVCALKRDNQCHTLSHATRSVFRTDTRRGRLTFSVAWFMLYTWFQAHIVRSPHNRRNGD